MCIAAGQQEILFALFVGWECLQTRKRTAEGAKGRPPLAPALVASTAEQSFLTHPGMFPNQLGPNYI